MPFDVNRPTFTGKPPPNFTMISNLQVRGDLSSVQEYPFPDEIFACDFDDRHFLDNGLHSCRSDGPGVHHSPSGIPGRISA